jgi:hypothetical protein
MSPPLVPVVRAAESWSKGVGQLVDTAAPSSTCSKPCRAVLTPLLVRLFFAEGMASASELLALANRPFSASDIVQDLLDYTSRVLARDPGHGTKL